MGRETRIDFGTSLADRVLLVLDLVLEDLRGVEVEDDDLLEGEVVLLEGEVVLLEGVTVLLEGEVVLLEGVTVLLAFGGVDLEGGRVSDLVVVLGGVERVAGLDTLFEGFDTLLDVELVDRLGEDFRTEERSVVWSLLLCARTVAWDKKNPVTKVMTIRLKVRMVFPPKGQTTLTKDLKEQRTE